MVFVNGQKFACATCIKGHRSTTCNHGERPLHEIKKKGRPSTQCPHCRELRKAKQVSVRCICGKDEATINGLKRTKSVSHDGRVSVGGVSIGGDDLNRSLSTQGQSPLEASDSSSDISCGCLEGMQCTCCKDKGGHVVTKPGPGPSRTGAFKHYQASHQRGTASLDFGNPQASKASRTKDLAAQLGFPSTSSLQSTDITFNNETGIYSNSTDGYYSNNHSNTSLSNVNNINNGSSTNVNNNNNAAISATVGSLFVQQLSPPMSASGTQSPSHYSLNMQTQQHQMQSQLCFDYASSSDYDSDHYGSGSYPYFSGSNYAVSNASDDLDDMDMQSDDTKAFMDGVMNGTTPSAEELRLLYSAFSNITTKASVANSPQPPVPTASQVVSPDPVKKSGACCGSSKAGMGSSLSRSSSVSSISSQSRITGTNGEGSISPNGCGCAISASACCCGALCACPGCLAYPNSSTNSLSIDSFIINGRLAGAESESSPGSRAGKGACCGPIISESSANESRYSVPDYLGLDTSRMQHPVMMNDDGALICGCGCGRATVDCAECFRDMCEFVGQNQDNMLGDDLELDMNTPEMINPARPLGYMTLQSQQDALSLMAATVKRQEQQQKIQQQIQEKLARQQREQLELEQLQRQLQYQQEQLQLEQLSNSAEGLNQLQLEFLDSEDWSFVDEIRTDPVGSNMDLPTLMSQQQPSQQFQNLQQHQQLQQEHLRLQQQQQSQQQHLVNGLQNQS